MATGNLICRTIAATVIAMLAAHADMLVAEGQDTSNTASLDRWPDNEPAGMTEILAIDGSSKDFGPGYRMGRAWLDDNRVTVVTDADSKYGKVIEKRFFVGDPSGWHGITYGDFGVFRELYFRIVFRLSPNWQWHKGHGKFFYYGGAGRERTANPTQFMLGWLGSGKIRWVDFGSGVGSYVPNGDFALTRDIYHTLEIFHVASTDGANGSLRMWLNGVEVPDFLHVGHREIVKLVNREWRGTRDLADKRFNSIQAFMFWGGQNDTKEVDDWIRLSELYISGRN